ncbi:uncharacterized protein EV420DRAFT_1567611 [Desarmillaria tabescens]|uniref:DUF974-domain-containing protein n=1 Tax=Armillaria tabescens TaxID=1929756 RepID=A0AA39JV00_ARMTA|nr:uncharacterized protein EV420DRAFT_1567611 [Desarmillaria tabescens]KAK0448380.1 hypothetical protein EV420DRAFT_1567611 [Desarmillaria tabescens]
MDGPAHLLSLKVMRVSRPSLASSWQPFYSSSPSFSAHSTASIMSLQGNTPLSGYPKTLRDFTQASELLTSSFLGETFSSCLCVNNEANVDVEGVHMKVEMQTVTAKVLLAEFGTSDHRLSTGDTLESIVHHEIKELGQHVLACTVTYRLPPGVRIASQTEDSNQDPALQTFRKFYKFAVTNPLSVKTKVHVPRSPSAMTNLDERDKVFLEVHIQNLTQEPIWFERMRFECADGWNVKDANNLITDEDEDEEKSIFTGTTALMNPQDMRQYIYILDPKTHTLEPPANAPGSIIPLGRLDISWRSSYGEPGRLLTSMLSRRIPLLQQPPQQPASALPPYLKRTVAAASVSGLPPRPRSPQHSQSRPSSPVPTSRPGSPFRNRPASVGPSRAQSPPLPPTTNPIPGIDVHLIVRDFPRSSIALQKPFTISCTLTISTSIPFDKRHFTRILTLAVQHVQPPKNVPVPASVNNLMATQSDSFTRVSTSGFSTPSPTSTLFNYPLAQQKLLVASPRQTMLEIDTNEALLPPPFSEVPPDECKIPQSGVGFCGASAIFLSPIQLSAADSVELSTKVSASQDFELTYIPLQPGFVSFGGLRALLVEDKFTSTIIGMDGFAEALEKARTLKVWDVVGEVWVPS